MGIVDRWKRRAWRPDAEAISNLPGKTPAIIVTGGSDGIGMALARAFASPDRTTILIARGADRLAKACSEIRGVNNADVLPLPLDISSPDAVLEIKAFLARADLYADILINSAGIGTTGEFAAEPADNLTRLTELNVTALTRLCRAFLPDMLIRGRGGIINVGSLGGFAPGPYQAAYYASKAYVVSLSRALARETRGQGIRVTCVVPGPVNTKFHERANGHNSFYRRILPALSPDQVARSTRRGYALGMGIITPGLFNNLTGLALRLLPAMLTTPIVAILLKPRIPKK